MVLTLTPCFPPLAAVVVFFVTTVVADDVAVEVEVAEWLDTWLDGLSKGCACACCVGRGGGAIAVLVLEFVAFSLDVVRDVLLTAVVVPRLACWARLCSAFVAAVAADFKGERAVVVVLGFKGEVGAGFDGDCGG